MEAGRPTIAWKGASSSEREGMQARRWAIDQQPVSPGSPADLGSQGEHILQWKAGLSRQVVEGEQGQERRSPSELSGHSWPCFLSHRPVPKGFLSSGHLLPDQL